MNALTYQSISKTAEDGDGNVIKTVTLITQDAREYVKQISQHLCRPALNWDFNCSISTLPSKRGRHFKN